MLRRILFRINHKYTIPLFGLTNNEWDDRIIGYVCEFCWEQKFNGKPWFIEDDIE